MAEAKKSGSSRWLLAVLLGCFVLVAGCCVLSTICAFLNQGDFDELSEIEFDSTYNDTEEEDPFDNFPEL